MRYWYAALGVVGIATSCRLDVRVDDGPAADLTVDSDAETEDSDAPSETDDTVDAGVRCEPREPVWRRANAPAVGLFAGGGIAWHPTTGLRTWGGGERNGVDTYYPWQVGFTKKPWAIPAERWHTLTHTEDAPCMVHADLSLTCRRNEPALPAAVVAAGLVDGSVCWMTTDGSPGCIAGDMGTRWPVSSTVPDDLVTIVAGRTVVPDAPEQARVFSCALDSKGHAWCDGPEVVEPFSAHDSCWVELAASAYSICGIRDDGAVVCRSQGTADLGVDVPSRTDLSHLSVASYGACALDPEGHVVCWGYGTPSLRGQVFTEAPTGGGYVDIAVASSTACAVNQDGLVTCWGDDLRSEVFDQPDMPPP